jgi:hypothetical protein
MRVGKRRRWREGQGNEEMGKRRRNVKGRVGRIIKERKEKWIRG